jgi:DNA-directed RNA polymerase subunit H (RpoH/RPB5)
MLNPVTRTKGNFSGKIVKIVTNSENIDVFKVKFRTHDEFMSLDDLKYFV